MHLSNMRNRSIKFNDLAFNMSFVVTLVMLIVLLAGSVFVIFSVKQYLERKIRTDIEQAMSASLRAIDLRIEKVEAVSKVLANDISKFNQDTATAQQFLNSFIQNNPDIVSADIIFKHHFNTTDSLPWAIMTYRGVRSPEIHRMIKEYNSWDILKKDENLYHSFLKNEDWWSIPYDAGFSSYLISYSTPLNHPSGILCTEITLDWIENLVITMKPDPACDITITSRNGSYVCEPDSNLINNGGKNLVVTKVIPRLGWTVTFTYPFQKINQKIHPIIWKMAISIFLLMIILVLSIVYCIRHIASPYMEHYWETRQQQVAIEEELQIASNIQLGMLPQKAPSFPNESFELHAILHPARIVGGDLYDYLTRDNKLYFCIGDVSGKGVPAALFMSEIRSLFHTLSYQMDDPATIAQEINQALSENNDECMFCTLFLGILDLKSYRLSYCNAGHNFPILIHQDSIKWIDSSHDGLLGALPNVSFHTETLDIETDSGLFLYTDGVTEAENYHHTLLGNDAVFSAVKSLGSDIGSKPFIDKMMDLIKNHVKDTEQSDDITMMHIRIQ